MSIESKIDNITSTTSILVKDAEKSHRNSARPDWLCFTALEANSTVSLKKYNGNEPAISIEYSTDGGDTWSQYTWDGNNGKGMILVHVGDSIWWRGLNKSLNNTGSTRHYFKMTGKISASGNVMSLLDPTCQQTTVPDYAFSYLFAGTDSNINKNTALVTAPKLPATTLGSFCYSNMFANCTSLVVAPELPATNLEQYCYADMFFYCTSLAVAPELPATTLKIRCYSEIFRGCTSLVVAPELPATSLVQGCYSGMFMECTSLKTAPTLPATTLAQDCYGRMFSSCTSLAVVPELSATSLANSFYEMFSGCTSLKYIKTLQTVWNNDKWLNNASSTGIFDCASTLDTSTRDASHVPSGWIVTHGANRLDADTTNIVKATATDVFTVCPSGSETGVITVSSALTLNAYPASSTDIAYCEVVLDIASNATVTAGTGLTFVDTLTAGKRNVCVVRWSGGVAKLYVTIVEDLPQA